MDKIVTGELGEVPSFEIEAQFFPVDPGAGALFSPCGKYRFALWRIFRPDLPLLMLIGLNPSTANAETDDPTIRRIKGLAKENGYGGIYMTNLFPFITPYPSELAISHLYMAENDYVLNKVSRLSKAVVFCWGNFITNGRSDEVKKMFTGALCFGMNKNGSPKHPLYLKASTPLRPFYYLLNTQP